MTREAIKALAAANGLTIPDERLDLLLREYESLTKAMARLESLELAREAEPAHVVALASPFTGSSPRR